MTSVLTIAGTESSIHICPNFAKVRTHERNVVIIKGLLHQKRNYLEKVGDLLTALGAVGLIAVVLELIIGWRMIPQSIILWFIIGSCVLLLAGLFMRNSGKSEESSSNKKKD